MKINKDKHIGRVLFIVEGSKTEFAILYRIFCKLLGYSYIEKRRNYPIVFGKQVLFLNVLYCSLHSQEGKKHQLCERKQERFIPIEKMPNHDITRVCHLKTEKGAIQSSFFVATTGKIQH